MRMSLCDVNIWLGLRLTGSVVVCKRFRDHIWLINSSHEWEKTNNRDMRPERRAPVDCNVAHALGRFAGARVENERKRGRELADCADLRSAIARFKGKEQARTTKLKEKDKLLIDAEGALEATHAVKSFPLAGMGVQEEELRTHTLLS